MFLHSNEMTMQSAKDWVANSEIKKIGTISIERFRFVVRHTEIASSSLRAFEPTPQVR
jgi:hypothetical protein